jgi:signal transduction histidine kinase
MLGRIRYVALFVVVTLGIAALSAFTAISLFREQVAVTELLNDHVRGRKAALELKECLNDLIGLENQRVEDVAYLHDRVRDLLGGVGEVANNDDEVRLYADMTAAFARYFNLWQNLPAKNAAGHEEARLEATRSLEEHVLQPCEEFERANNRRIEHSAEQHERILRQLAWGLGLVGVLGSVAGLILGFGIARNLSRSVQGLRIQLQDAAGKMLPGQPEILLSGSGGLDSLRDDMTRLSQQIGQTMQTLHQRELEVMRAKQLAAVGQLAAGVGHEIRNPLTSVKLLVQAALEDGGGGLSAEDLKIIEAEIRRMEGSLRLFLDFARPPKVERRRTTIDAVLSRVVELLRGRAVKQRVAIEYVPVEVALEADPSQLQQVFVNLGLNALDAMPSGGTLSFAVAAGGSQTVSVEVRDTGPGIDPAIVPRLFEPFASSKETGLGLGLVICQRIVEEHRGTIAAAKAVGSGAVFTVKLPTAG